jgi:hypothetical protein
MRIQSLQLYEGETKNPRRIIGGLHFVGPGGCSRPLPQEKGVLARHDRKGGRKLLRAFILGSVVAFRPQEPSRVKGKEAGYFNGRLT